MNQQKVFVLGDVPLADREMLEQIALYHNIIINFSENIGDLPAFSMPPLGFVSYVQCSLPGITTLFGCLPIGTGEKIPLFQLIPGNEIPEYLLKFPMTGVFETPISSACAFSIITAINHNESINNQMNILRNELINQRKQKFELVQIGISLSRENDLVHLLDSILTASRQIVFADAGSIYVRERKGAGGPLIDSLRFMGVQNDSVELSALPIGKTIPINENSIAGYVAFHGNVANIEDVSDESNLSHLRFTEMKFEEPFNYKIKSILAVPLKNMAGEVVGVLELINKKKNFQHKLTTHELVESDAVKFDYNDEECVQAVASQAAVPIERVLLHESISGDV